MSRRLKPQLVLAALVACGAVMSNNAYAQGGFELAPRVVMVNSGDCGEYAKALLDDVIINEGRDKSFIIIARPGTGERSRKLIQQRLAGLSYYLIESRGIPKGGVILAEGERVRGLGHVEVYVGGNLRLLFKMERNKSFVSDCHP